MTVGQKLVWIGENLKNVFGKGYAVGHREGYTHGYDHGAQEGGVAAREVCLMSHLTDTVYGSGVEEFSFSLPFCPDIVTVYTTHPFSGEKAGCYRGFTVDLRACGPFMGNVYYTYHDGVYKSAWLKSSLDQQTVSYGDGVFRFHISADSMQGIIWMENVAYNIVAVKLDEDGKQVIRDQILSLPDDSGGSVSYIAAVISSYFSNEEWQRLTAQKPNWEFVLK